MSQVTLTLGNFTFSGMQLPSAVSGGGSHRLVVHRLIGGIRVIQALGRDDQDIEWQAYFTGPDAVSSAQTVDAMRIAGQSHTLTYDQFNYTVIVKSFEFEYEAPFRVPYRIVCQVVADNTSAPTSPDPTTIDGAIIGDMSTIHGLASGIDDSFLSQLTAALGVAVDAVSTFVDATQSTINAVLQPLSAVQVQAQNLMDSTDSNIGASPGFAGIVTGAQFGSNSTGLNAQIVAVAQMTDLLQVSAACGRMAKNLNAVGASANQITIAGGNLFQVASDEYGDATAWTGIARANDITDPFLTGEVNTLTIPPQPDKADGVLSF